MTYIQLPPNTVLTEQEYVAELNKAIKSCVDCGYIDGMKVIHIGSGYKLLLNGEDVVNAISAPILSRAAKLVNLAK